MTAETEVTHEDVSQATPITARDAAADASADASIVSEALIVSAAAEETRNHQPRGSNGRFVGRRSDGILDAEDEALPADRFLDREISWLQFNERVLQLAGDDNIPLLELPLPGDLRVQPRRVLHGSRRRPQAPDRDRHRRGRHPVWNPARCSSRSRSSRPS